MRFADPEWLLFQAFLLLPALLCAVTGDYDRASFFARLAIYTGFLKWLGWLLLTRWSARERAFLAFPMEIFAGVSVPLLWFYLRNAFTAVAPRSYSLVELRVACYAVLVLQAAAGLIIAANVVRNRSSNAEMRRALLTRVSIYVPFVLTLTLVLWSVAKEVFVPSQDGWFHSFIARVFLNDGVLYEHFNGNQAIFYTSAFGALNAITAAASGLTVVQAHNLQHIFWIVTGMWLVTATVARLSDRLLAPLHAVPPLFLSAYPAHNFPPDVYWTHTPQQTASALLVAIPLLSLAIPVTSRRAFYTAMAMLSILSLAVLALNPVCAFYLPFSCGAALVISWRRAGRALGLGAVRLVAAQAVLLVLAGMLVLGVDRFYSAMIRSGGTESYMKSTQFGGTGSTGKRVLSLSPARGFSADLGSMSLLPDQALGFGPPPAGSFRTDLPGRFLPWLAVSLTLLVGALAIRKRTTLESPVSSLATAAGASLAAWVVIRAWGPFMSAAIRSGTLDAMLVQSYLIFLARRIELWLMLLSLSTAATGLLIARATRVERRVSLTALAAAAAVLAIWWLPLWRTYLNPRLGYLMPRNVGFAGRTTKEDIELTRWMDENLPRGKGLVGTTAIPFKLDSATLLFPIDSAMAPSLYGRQYNFTFQVFDPARPYGYDDYVEHVLNYFDAEWLIRNGIRYFYVPHTEIYPNLGITRARQIGLLEPVRTVSSAGIYAIRQLPWRPKVIAGPRTYAGSYQVNWRPDGTGVAQGHDPQVIYVLDRPMFVHAIRFKYALPDLLASPASPQLFWRNRGQDFTEAERTAHLRLEPTVTEQTLTLLVHDTIESFRFDPDVRARSFRIRDVELLVRP